MKETDIYGPCDKAIKKMNRRSLNAFNKLKLSDFDRLSVVRTVKRTYRRLAKEAEKEYLEVARDAYVIAMLMCEEDEERAQQMADEAITAGWIDDVLTQTDFVTLYRFDTETERKAERLVEAIAVVDKADEHGDMRRNIFRNRDSQIDQALKLWVAQLAQYAINMTDYAMLQAFDDAGVKEAEWVAANDERTCGTCSTLGGNVYKLTEFPAKPHPRCRCTARPVRKK